MGQFIFGLFAGIVVGLVMEWVIDWTGLLPKRPQAKASRKPISDSTGTSSTDTATARSSNAIQSSERQLVEGEEMRSNSDVDGD